MHFVATSGSKVVRFHRSGIISGFSVRTFFIGPTHKVLKPCSGLS